MRAAACLRPLLRSPWFQLLLRMGVLAALLPAAHRISAAEQPFFRAELIFPLEHWHNHSSSIVELPGGDLLVCWYHGSGERRADDVIIEAARKRPQQREWGPRFTLADTPNFPDTNPTLFLDSRLRLWLLWPVIIANEWHTALMKYRITTRYPVAGAAPSWEFADNMLLIPRNFEPRVRFAVEGLIATDVGRSFIKELQAVAARAGDKYFSRMGWMTRTHPLELPSGRILVPLYSDGFDFSLIAFTDDGGVSWRTSEPLVSLGGVQPTIVRRKDGSLIAWFRDNGPPPKRLLISESFDQGETWTPPEDTEIPNPGSSVEVIRLSNGMFAMANNDTEKGRHSLVIALSDDEGKTWKWRRHVERDTRQEGPGSFHYPSLIQASDGSLHLTYSYFLNHLPEGAPRKSIKHAHFNVAWIQQGDER